MIQASTGVTPVALVVNPYRDEREAYSFALKHEGFEAVECDDLETAIAVASARTPEIVVTDAVLPGDDGLELTRRLRRDRRTEQVPVIVISGLVTDVVASQQAAVAAGATLFLLKPCEPRHVVVEARRLIAEARALIDRATNERAMSREMTAHTVHLVRTAQETVERTVQRGRDRER
jgi:PleD family two-component response regulator